ncbi:zinc ABC transporter substrate-binding protein [Saccharopolyspora sp. WRP15-2]|uniref:Zinc ABC transporter substrate-binding protein n=1 Tax=Saccharopolyspora oryzae TaxID=2997343 RepID=A0ABT4VA49_9PSEU|nr:zinc ABC transporter substrate-binding protein [Saccharopolyspora oryzae]MDA3630847.1 zinc ABC transporter substrate-binding protein [Saccharopolyspora oryzae]
MTVRIQQVRRTGAVALAGLAALSMAACSSGQPGGDHAGPHKLAVVASTSVWGSVAQEIGGDAVQVDSIITDPSADPHSYESTPHDAAKVNSADLVVFNGGGYDEFMEKDLASAGQGKPAVQAMDSEHATPEPEAEPEPGQDNEPGHDHAQESGHEAEPGHDHEHDHSVNEHVWYDLHATQEVASKIADELGRLQPENAQKFHQAAEKFNADLSGLQGHVDQIAAANQGKKVIVTEPVAHYLVDAAKLTDITPPSFVNAVEAENDPPAAAVAEIQSAVDSKQASAVIFNPQTETPVTQQVKTRAEQNRTPVVEMRETLPPGRTYLQWMNEQIDALDAALKH